MSFNVNKGIVSEMSERPAQAALGGDIGHIVMQMSSIVFPGF